MKSLSLVPEVLRIRSGKEYVRISEIKKKHLRTILVNSAYNIDGVRKFTFLKIPFISMNKHFISKQIFMDVYAAYEMN